MNTPTATSTPIVDAHAWAVDDQQIVRSKDGGLTWSTPLFSSADVALKGITFVDRERGWAVGGSDFGFGAALLRTTDGGATWASQLENVTGLPRGPGVATSFGFFDVAFTTPQHGVAVGAAQQGVGIFSPPPLIVVTDDAGAHWRPVDITSARRGGILRSVCLIAGGAGIAVGYTVTSGGIVVVTPDEGATWTDISTATATNFAGGDLTKITSTACAPPNQFWISGVNIGTVPVGTRSDLLYSSDKGKTWAERTPAIGNVSGDTFQLLPLAFVDVNGWTIPGPSQFDFGGSSPFALRTSDAGGHWSQQDFPSTFVGDVSALAFVNAQNGVAVGAGSQDSTGSRAAAALITDDGGRTWHTGSFPPGVSGLLDVTIVP